MNNNHYCVIMAGGCGSRLWPASTTSCPKQFMDIADTGKTSIRNTYDRFASFMPKENIIVVTVRKYKDLVMQNIPELKEENLFLEPYARDTAPCIAYSAYKLFSRDPEATIVVTPADHVIENMQVRMEEGTVLKNDLTRYELQKETLELQRTVLQDGCRILNHQIVTVLHLPDSVKVVPDSSMLSCGILALEEQDWQQKAAQNSIDLRRSELGVRVNEQNLRLERSARLPQIAVMAAEHLDGPITIEVPVLDRNFNYWYVGIGLKYDLSSLFKSGRKIRQARLNVRRAQESRQLSMEQTETAVQAGYVNFMTSFSDLRTREKTVELAYENYAVISNRYDNGLALLTDLLDAGNMKLSADLALENARTELDRYEKLLSRNAVTRQQYDNVHTAFQTAKARYERASRTKESASLLKSGQSYRLEQCEAAVRLAQADCTWVR